MLERPSCRCGEYGEGRVETPCDVLLSRPGEEVWGRDVVLPGSAARHDRRLRVGARLLGVRDSDHHEEPEHRQRFAGEERRHAPHEVGSHGCVDVDQVREPCEDDPTHDTLGKSFSERGSTVGGNDRLPTAILVTEPTARAVSIAPVFGNVT